MVGEVMAEEGDYKGALHHNKQYLVMATESQDSVNVQRALATLAHTYLVMSSDDDHHLDKALKYCNKCLAAISDIPSRDIDQKERSQMTGRALENLGQVKWKQNHLDEAEENFSEAELKYKQFKLWSDLVRLSLARSVLLLETESEDCSKALKQTEKCLEAAEKLEDGRREEAVSEALIYQFKIHLFGKSFSDAKQALLRCNNFKKTDEVVQKYVKKHLKMIIKICQKEDEIINSNSECLDCEAHSAYEDIADILVKFEGSTVEKRRVNRLVLEYYEIAFNKADTVGNTEVLPSLNNSIARTHEDLQDWNQALVFYERQLEYEAGRYQDQCSTYSNIAMMRENMQSSYTSVMEARKRWLDTASMIGDHKQQHDALKEILRYQKMQGRSSEADDTQLMLDSLGVESESERLVSESQRSDLSDQFSDIDLEAEVRTQEASVTKSRIAKTTPLELTKKNAKGETPLFQLIQKPGQESRMISMIERGALLEVVDNAGWTPLLEATGEMNIKYMKILTDAGADINNKNKENGITPLIYAAQRGFLDGIEYLLDKKADVTTKTRQGHSALSYLRDHLKKARSAGSDPSYRAAGVMERLEESVTRVEKMLTKLGRSTEAKTVTDDDDDECSDDNDDEDRTLTEDNIENYSRTMRSPSPPSPPLMSPKRKSMSQKNVKLYQQTMDSLKGSSSRTAFSQISDLNVSNIVRRSGGVEECLDDWLVDDVGDNQKKRKRPVDPTESLTDVSKRKKNTENREPTIDLTSSPTFKSSSSMKSRLKLSKKSSQPLISSILPRSRTPSPLPNPPPPPQEPLPVVMTQVMTPASVTRVKISIEGEMFLIPLSDQHLTVGQLSLEAAARYCRQRGSEPVLSVRTEDGAVLDSGDRIQDVLVTGDKLIGSVLHWNNKPSAERYREACAETKVPCFKNIRESLTSLTRSNSLDLSRLHLRQCHAAPVWNSLRGNLSLRHLVLSQCKLTDQCLAPLISSVLPSITHLTSLDLSYNLLTSSTLSSLSSSAVSSLQSVSLSGNMLNDYCLPSITSLINNCPSMTQLQVSRCNLTEMWFRDERFEFAEAVKKSRLKHLDISYNNLKITGLEILMSCLPASGLRHLDISSCTSDSDRLGDCLEVLGRRGNPNIDLTSLSLAGLSMTDAGLLNLCPQLRFCARLNHLNLDNNNFTSSALSALMNAALVESVPLSSLSCAVSSSEQAETFWKSSPSDVGEKLEALLHSNCSRLELLVVPFSQENCSELGKIWNEHFGSKSEQRRDGCGNIRLSLQ